MKEEELLDALAVICEGKGSEGPVEIDAGILLSAHNELKEKLQLRKELEMARDEAQGMKPSVARKLNEKIRALEAELETLRTNKKVSELEKKVKFLEHELKQSYTTKNFTLKSGLLELEKQYRAHMNVDPAMAAFWADVTVLLDEKKDKESQPHVKGPPTRSSDGTTASVSSSATSQQKQQQHDITDASGTQLVQLPAADTSPSQGAATASGAAGTSIVPQQSRQVHSHPAAAGVLQQVEAFNTIISEEAAGAASIPASSDNSSTASQGDMVVRQAGTFRIVKSHQQAAPPVTDNDGTAAAAVSSVLEEPLQPVRVLADSYSSRCKDITFKPLPASLGLHTVSPSSSQQPAAVDASALQSCRDSVCSSVAELQQLFSQLPVDSSSDVSQLERQVEQLVSSAQQLQQANASEQPQQQHQTMDALQSIVQQLSSALQQGSISSSKPQAEAAQQRLNTLQHELQELQQLQQHAAGQACSQQLLVHVFADFIRQLEQQGLITSSNGSTVPADGQSHHVLLQLLQQFLRVNPQVPQLLAAGLPAAAPAPGDNSTAAGVGAISSGAAAAVQQPLGRNQVGTQAAMSVDLQHAETQSEPLPSPSVHASTQSEAVGSSTAETQYDTVHEPPLHASTQAEQATAGTQAEGVESSHAMTQSEPLPSPTSHVATQAGPSESVVHSQVQADLRPQVSEAETQADLSPAEALAEHTSTPTPAAPEQEMQGAVGAATAAQTPVASAAASSSEQGQQLSGSGVIYSASGAELPVSKAALGQQLDVLDQLQRQRSPESAAAAQAAEANSIDRVSAVLEVPADELQDIQAVSTELRQLRADNMELAASLQVTKSLVDHLNSSMKEAIDKADDAEAEAAHARAELKSAMASLQQLQSEHAELTKLLIDAKVEIAEKKGELLKLVRGMRRAVESPSNPLAMVKELQGILAVLPASEGGFGELEGRDSTDMQTRVATPGSGGGLAGFAAGLGQALSGGSIARRSRAPSDSGTTAEGGSGSGGGRRRSEQ